MSEEADPNYIRCSSVTPEQQLEAVRANLALWESEMVDLPREAGIEISDHFWELISDPVGIVPGLNPEPLTMAEWGSV